MRDSVCRFSRYFIIFLVVLFLSVGFVSPLCVSADDSSQIVTTTTESTDYSEDGVFSWIGSKISALGKSILDGLSALFLPDEDFISEKFNKIKDKFSFWESIVNTVKVFFSLLQETDFSEPPVVTVHLFATENSRYNWGDTTNIFDFSWYAPYKQAGDTMITAFMWLFFVWRVYLRLPDILRGSGSSFSDLNDIYEERHSDDC